MSMSVDQRPVRTSARSRLRNLPWWGGWVALSLSLAAYVVIGLVLHQPFHEGLRALRYFDLRIYRGAAERVVRGGSLYGAPIVDGLGFTYPPFAALLSTPLACASTSVDALVVTALNVLLLVWSLRRTLMIPAGRRLVPVRPASGSVRAWSLAALAAAVALWLEPVSVALGYGQIDLLITALVVFDLSRPDTAKTKGAAIGLAAAIKLTPLLFLAYLLLSGRRRPAAVGTGVFLGSIAVSYAALARDTTHYWGGLVLDFSRVGSLADASNQSLQGAIARLDPGAHAGIASHLTIAAIALLGLALAVHASRHGDEAAGFSLAAITTLLASPISWTHHWTLAVPALLLLWRRAHQRRSRPLATAAAALALLGCAYLPEYTEGPLKHPGLGTLLTSDPYTLAAMTVLVVAAVAAIAVQRTRQRAQAWSAPGPEGTSTACSWRTSSGTISSAR